MDFAGALGGVRRRCTVGSSPAPCARQAGWEGCGGSVGGADPDRAAGPV